MEIIQRPRAGGKTAALVAWYKENPEQRGILVLTAREKKRLEEHFGVPSSAVVLASSPGVRGRHVTWGVDNADLILQALTQAWELGPWTVTE